MAKKSKQLRAEENKTISISELTQLRFKMLKADNGIVEVVNTVDYGRICSLKLSDFKSIGDAQVYAQLLVLAPQLLGAYLSDHEKLKQVVTRFEKKFRTMKKKQVKGEKISRSRIAK